MYVHHCTLHFNVLIHLFILLIKSNCIYRLIPMLLVMQHMVSILDLLWEHRHPLPVVQTSRIYRPMIMSPPASLWTQMWPNHHLILSCHISLNPHWNKLIKIHQRRHHMLLQMSLWATRRGNLKVIHCPQVANSKRGQTVIMKELPCLTQLIHQSHIRKRKRKIP